MLNLKISCHLVEVVAYHDGRNPEAGGLHYRHPVPAAVYGHHLGWDSVDSVEQSSEKYDSHAKCSPHRPA